MYRTVSDEPYMPARPEQFAAFLSDRFTREKLGISRQDLTLLRNYYYACVSFVDYQIGRIIRALNEAGYKNIVCYDPVAMDGFQRLYQLEYRCAASYAEIVREADIFAITTAWPEFGDIRERTDKPVVDCRYML